MSKKFMSLLGAALMIGALIAATIVPVAAASTSGAGPDSALAPDGQWAPIASGQQVWYAFQYAGDDSSILVRMGVSPTDGASFDVWTPAQLEAWAKGQKVDAIGSGSSNDRYGGDLIWSGHFNTPGTYYVIVGHSGSVASNYAVSVSGSGVSVTTPVAAAESAAPAATETVAATSTTASASPAPAEVAAEATPAGTGPGDAKAIDGEWSPLSAGQQVWYAFSFGGGDTPVKIRMAVSPSTGAGFAVWTPAEVARWASDGTVDPVGRGSVNDAEGGDLVWRGNLSESGTYYVVVSKIGTAATNYQLSIQ